MAHELDRARIEAIIQAIVDRSAGEWLLVGGGLVALWLEPRRVTEDLDLVGLQGTRAERLALMETASDLGLPVEVVNSAADFFVHRVPDWKEQIEPFFQGKVGTVYRPAPTLFLLLKLQRLSEQDLEDCRTLLERVARDGMSLDRERVRGSLRALPPTEDKALAKRRKALAGLLLDQV
ncbi:MAG: hypothetical protein V3T05_07915 [Myxococcota bacterium]